MSEAEEEVDRADTFDLSDEEEVLRAELIKNQAEGLTSAPKGEVETIRLTQLNKDGWHGSGLCYNVSIPNYEGGEVESKSDYDLLAISYSITAEQYDKLKAERDALLSRNEQQGEKLADLQAWIEFALQEVKIRAGRIPPTFTDGYTYVEIPEWKMRQKLSEIRMAREGITEEDVEDTRMPRYWPEDSTR